MSCLTAGLISTDAAKAEGDSVGAGPYTIYMIPKADMANAGGSYRLNYQNTNDSWGQANFTFTGRTHNGRPVYKTTFSPTNDKSKHCQLQVDSGGSFSWDLYNGEHSWSDWNGKYFDADSSGSWNNSVSFDTYCVYTSSTSNLGDLTWNASSSKYTLTQQLSAGTTYKLRVYNSSYGYGSKFFQCDAKTQTSTGSTTMYAYKDASDTAVVSVTPTITANYTFEWTLADSRNDDAKQYVKNGSLNIIFPTTYTVTYSLDSNVTKGTITGGTDNGSGTITALSCSNVVINVSYASGYEYDSSQSSINGATVSNNGTTFTYSSISENKSLTVRAKQSAFSVSIQVTNNTGGTVSPSSYSGVLPGESKQITATPDSQNNYVFSGWTASPAGNVTFVDAGSAITTFTATAAATIYANFTQETLFPVTVKLDGLTETTVNAGNTINPTLTRVDRSGSDYEFTGWTLTGDVALAPGYSATDTTIKITATGAGTVTANYTHVDYIYFYAALQSSWDSNPLVTVDGSNVGAYAWIANKANNDTAKTLYSNGTGTTIGGNNCYLNP